MSRIGGGFLRPPADEPSQASLMASAKNLHFLFAVIFTLNGLLRAYWAFMGRTYKQWGRFFIWQLDFWREAIWKLKDYLTLRYTDFEPHTLGHNTLATLTYMVVFVIATIMGLTGFAMKGAMDPGGLLDAAFGWVIVLLGSEALVRMVHRMMMWAMIAFMIHHISFVIYLEVLREKGLLSSMISGLKTRPADWRPVRRPWAQEP